MTVQGNRVVCRAWTTTWSAPDAEQLPNPVAVVGDDHRIAVEAVRTHLAYGTELLIAAAGRVDPAAREGLLADGFHVLDGGDVHRPIAAREAVDGRLWTTTSGSTGRPKRVAHSLETLTTTRGDWPERVWLCPYAPGSYAWWQLVTLSLHNPGQHLVTVDPADREEWPRLALEHGVTAASGTPTFWRQTLLASPDDLRALPLAQITLGGEPVDQPLLDQLHEAVPTARISWIYASSEAGAAITVHDGHAGFPVSWLDRALPNGATLSVVDDELVVTSAHAGIGVEPSFRTGDRVEIVDGRVHITGRTGADEINVGGAKVSAGHVRHVLLTHPSVYWARVTGSKARLVGQIVTADVVADPVLDEVTLRRWAAGRLPEHAVPRRISFLRDIPMKESLKSDV